MVAHGKDRLGDAREHLVRHAAVEQRDLASGNTPGGVPGTYGIMKGLVGQRREMSAADQARKDPGTGRTEHIVDRLGEKPLELGRDGQDCIEESGVGEHAPEDGSFHRRKSEVAGQEGPGLEEDVQGLDPAWAVGLARAAQQAGVQAFLDPERVLDDFVGQAFEQGDLAPGHMSFESRLAVEGTHGLAHAAPHAGHELIVNLLEESYQFAQFAHVILP